LGRPDLVALCERGPGPHQQPVIDFLQERFATRTQAEWIEWFRGRDVCFAPVRNLREAFDDPQANARGMRLVDELGQEHIGLPIKFSDEPGRPDFRLPRLGEHTEEVLRSAGYDDAGLAALRDAGAY
jgi:crotonobetainyl-CoA:carnitine CoA-transferase CaiB-like acyl-CoA transferase